MDHAAKIKLKRKEDELKSECLEYVNQSLAEVKDKNNGIIPHKTVFNMIQSSAATQP